MQPLCQAVHDNDESRVREILYLTDNPNERVYPFVPEYTFCYRTRVRKMSNADRMSDTALFIAVKENKPDMCHILLEAGADVDMPIQNYMTPLRYAVEHNNVEICKILMNAGARVENALTYAIENYSYDICKALVENGATSLSALYHASVLGHADICTLLRTHGFGATWSVDVFKNLSTDVLHALETLSHVSIDYTYYSVMTADEETFTTPPWILNDIKCQQLPLAD